MSTSINTDSVQVNATGPAEGSENQPNDPTEKVEVIDWEAKFNEMKTHSREWEKRSKENKSALEELSKERDSLSQQLSEIQAERDKLQASNDVFSVATEYGVSGELLRGSTREELEEHAKALKSALKANAYEPVPAAGKQPGKSVPNEEQKAVRGLFGKN